VNVDLLAESDGVAAGLQLYPSLVVEGQDVDFRYDAGVVVEAEAAGAPPYADLRQRQLDAVGLELPFGAGRNQRRLPREDAAV